MEVYAVGVVHNKMNIMRLITMNKKGFVQAVFNPLSIIILIVALVLIFFVMPFIIASTGAIIAGIIMMVIGTIIIYRTGQLPAGLIVIALGLLIILGVNFDILSIAS